MVGENSVTTCLRIYNGICTSCRLVDARTPASGDSSYHKSLRRFNIYRRRLCVVFDSWNVMLSEQLSLNILAGSLEILYEPNLCMTHF